MQTEKPYWLDEAYSSPFSAVDTGLISRPLSFSRRAEAVIMKYCNTASRFLDYGGGNGVFVRLMRDKGFDFYRMDKYAANIYATGFDLLNIDEKDRTFELLTSVEVVEHFEEPLKNFAEMFSFSKNILCTTLFQETAAEDKGENWFYLAEFSGQHVSFYTKKSMSIIAEIFKSYYYTNDLDIHFFTQKKIDKFNVSDVAGINCMHTASNFLMKYLHKMNFLLFSRVMGGVPESLTMKDQEYLKKIFFGNDDK